MSYVDVKGAVNELCGCERCSQLVNVDVKGVVKSLS